MEGEGPGSLRRLPRPRRAAGAMVLCRVLGTARGLPQLARRLIFLLVYTAMLRAAAAHADPALVIRYFGSKNDLFKAARRPDFSKITGSTRPLTADSLTRSLAGIPARAGNPGVRHRRTRRGRHQRAPPQPAKRGTGQAGARRLRPAAGGSARVEVIAALIVGVGFLRQRIRTPALSALNAEQLTDLLRPLVAGMPSQIRGPAPDQGLGVSSARRHRDPLGVHDLPPGLRAPAVRNASGFN
jgi:AcrR family transcriptional regulator